MKLRVRPGLVLQQDNPHLNDLVICITRDSQRKLGYDDRWFGTMRLALAQGVKPIHRGSKWGGRRGKSAKR